MEVSEEEKKKGAKGGLGYLHSDRPTMEKNALSLRSSHCMLYKHLWTYINKHYIMLLLKKKKGAEENIQRNNAETSQI